MKRTRLRVALLCLLLPGAGCVTFERQTVVAVFPPDGKEVRALLVYEGLRVHGDRDEDLKAAKDQLRRMPGSRSEFCLGSPALHVNLAQDRQGDAVLNTCKSQVARHLVVKGGAFFETKEGGLCAYQTVTVRDPAGFVRDVNEATSALLLPELATRLADPSRREAFWDEEMLRRFVLASTNRYAWWELEPGRVRFNVPADPAAAVRLKRALFRPDVFAEARKLPEPADGLRLLGRVGPVLADNAWSIDQRPDRLALALGFGEGRPLRLVVQTEPSPPYRPLDRQLVDYAKTLKAPFQTEQTVEALVQDFIKKNGVLK
jgi:hypothetical protein